MTNDNLLGLPDVPTLRDLQAAVHTMEAHHGWLTVDLVHNCFLMGEEVGELFKAVRKYEKLFGEAAKGAPPNDQVAQDHVGDEIIDVFNYLCAIANRLDIDLEAAFRRKNGENMQRTWS